MKEESPKAIIYALAANFGIAVCKFAAASFTGSGSMFAEAIHSTADCGNQLLLLFGLRQARRPASPLHPMGGGREINFYSLLVALLLFFVGGAFSVYEGVHRLMAREPLQYAYVALVVLGVSVVLEAFSLWGALREIRRVHPEKNIWRWFRETRESELLVVAGEDIAALVGLAIAFAAVLLTLVTGNPMYDAFGSIAVGLLLMVIAGLVAREVKSMIVGESASPEVRRAIEAHLRARSEIRGIINMITLQWGRHVVVAVQAEMIDYASGRAMVDAINIIEADLQAAFPQVRWVFFEPDVPRA
ncbi:cation diffusion facilitator family transporter [Paraburkholderia sp. GV068]|jgi:cation diffusion facilitator family transporter|uniref:Cation diffusion facilitator family transporter n=1 Tax=Paraburkholderia graminis TaxID=60548 RepID=A0ABD5CHB9_9BURK|nr:MULTISPECIES: cation diffusion facilitator family transporter [Paraburkholderia]MDQ0626419.1 cation diffusion facilitator family transporter [Paraburkholderia graminis]MDR6204724.1 cation diffusion facilitator family transporter [Paraburkholderia graminis]PTQ95915.1 cation diffusion facilitator family transporter [Paraburkholderia sp. GV072]PUB02253.1 cation diffusion facilitator family transporter [Paraburkholderia sp. GV068]